MKKILIAAAFALAGVAAQASNVNWGINTTASLDATKFASGTAYLICVNDLARPTTLTEDSAGDWYNANIAKVKSSAFRTAAVADGGVYESEDISEAIGRKNYWLLIDNGEAADADHFFAISTSTKALNITTSALSVSAVWTASQFGVFNVPEPTSGLMLLLGMAGLALLRRRA